MEEIMLMDENFKILYEADDGSYVISPSAANPKEAERDNEADISDNSDDNQTNEPDDTSDEDKSEDGSDENSDNQTDEKSDDEDNPDDDMGEVTPDSDEDTEDTSDKDNSEEQEEPEVKKLSPYDKLTFFRAFRRMKSDIEAFEELYDTKHLDSIVSSEDNYEIKNTVNRTKEQIVFLLTSGKLDNIDIEKSKKIYDILKKNINFINDLLAKAIKSDKKE